MHMRIGQLAERTGVSRRLLRYYEEQGLIVSRRAANGYREYDEASVDRVLQIKALLDVGLPTRVIRQILPCLDKAPVISISDATPETIATLERERDRMADRIRCLTRNQEAITRYLDAVRTASSTGANPAGARPRAGAGAGASDGSGPGPGGS